MHAETSVAVIGLGSRGLGVLERLLSLASCPTRIDLIDPVADGTGVHHRQQPDYLLLNTICSQVSMFPDGHTVGETAPIAGPSLFDWVRERDLRIADDGFSLGSDGRPVRPTDFLPRRILGEYLNWFLELLLEQVPAHVTVTVRRSAAIGLTSTVDDRLRVELADGSELFSDHVFLTTGYTGRRQPPSGDHLIAEPYPMPEQWAGVNAGQRVAIAGFGLSAMDAMSCLTVGRGGRFQSTADRLSYLPSGREPRILLYSRAGLPCRARPKVLEYGPAHRPLVFTKDHIDAIRAIHGPQLDFDADIWPLIHTELRIAYRCCQARITGPAAARELDLRLTSATAAGKLDSLLASLDAELGAIDPRGLVAGTAEISLQDSENYQRWLVRAVRQDLAEGALGLSGSLVKGTLDILRQFRDTFRHAVDFGGLTATSLDSFMSVTVPMLNRAVVGPQYERHAELVCLIEAGIVGVPFGPDPAIEATAGGWTISSRQLRTPYRTHVDWLAAGWVGLPSVANSASPLIESLYEHGMIRPHRPDSRQVVGIDVDSDQHPIDANGRPDQRIWVLGPLCEGATFYNNLVPSPGSFSRPVHDAHRCVSALFAMDRQLAGTH
jgi:uncharacterized NAD(P)/FAD-binding protein YdhS